MKEFSCVQQTLGEIEKGRSKNPRMKVERSIFSN